jgi:hypothetical protein
MKTVGVIAGGAALLAIGVWLGGGHRDATPAAAAEPIAVKPIAMPHAKHAPSLAVATPGLGADLRDADPKVRRAAVAELAADPARDPAALIAASRDGNLDVAAAATESLGVLYRDGRITAQDLAALITDRNAADKVRVAALNGLGLVPARDSATVLADLLAHGDRIGRRSAAILLVHQDAQLAVPALIGALADGDEQVRTNAHDSLLAFARGRDFGQDTAAWQRWWQSRAI